jgi:hypothetical protein
MELRRIQHTLACFSLLVLLAGILLACGCVRDTGEQTGQGMVQTTPEVPPTTSGAQGLRIVIKDPGMPEIRYLQPNITEVQLRTKDGQWITIWSSPAGKMVKLTPDGTEVGLDTVVVPAGTYTGTRLKVSTIDVEVDVNRDGDTLDKNVQVVLTLDEFNALPPREKPTPPVPGTPPVSGTPTPPPSPTPPPQPSAPGKPGKMVGATAEEKPGKPSQPQQPTQPPQPTQPAGPQGTGGPAMQGGQQPTPPYRIEGDLVYLDVYMDEKHTVTLNDYIVPYGEEMWKTDFVYDGKGGALIYDFTLHPLMPKGQQITVDVIYMAPPPEIPVELVSLSVSPDSVNGGTPSTGTVTINLQAPTGGQVVQLSVSPQGSLLLPANITIEAGATTGTFNIATPVVTSTLNATIAAEVGGSRQTAQLTIKPATVPALSALTVSPASVVNGDTSTGTVTLDMPAPAGGQLVRLSPVQGFPALVPDRVMVNPGQTSATFRVTTSRVNSPVNVTLTASLGNSRKTTQVSVNPTPALSALILTPASVSGGSPSVGRVVLSSAAGTIVQPVQVSASSSTYLTLPATVIVNPGATEANFTISTKTVTTQVNVTVIAELGSSRQTAQLTIKPVALPALSALTVSPASVVNGDTSTGTLTLDMPAPAGGQLVMLSPTASFPALVPDRVMVNPGQTSATFRITTYTVSSPTNVTITGTLGDSRKTAQVTVNPTPTLSGLAVSPASVAGGSPAVGTVYLTSIAPSAGQVVLISGSPGTSVTMPPTVTVPPGAKEVTFTITTKAVSSPVDVTITAILFNARQSARLTLLPQTTAAYDVTIEDLNCLWISKAGPGGVKTDCVHIISTGTAKGPVGARLELPILAWSDDKFNCGSWTYSAGALIAVGGTCTRKVGQPETTSWYVDTGGEECPLRSYFANTRTHTVKIYKGNELTPQDTDSKTKGCTG